MKCLSLEEYKGTLENVLVIVDHFINYAVVVPTKTTTSAFFGNLALHYGLPAKFIWMKVSTSS